MPTLSAAGSALRLKRLLDLVHWQGLDAAMVFDVRDIYYFTGVLLPAELPAALKLDAAGQSILIGPKGYPSNGHELIEYPWNHRGTRNLELAVAFLEVLVEAFGRHESRTLGVQLDALRHNVSEVLDFKHSRRVVAIDAPISEMQRCKDADEVEMIRASIRANLGAYEAVRATIRPGASELNVLAAGIRGAMEAAGDKVFHDGDYQCGAYNGPARNRRVEAGELYIVDAWTCCRGYWSDMSRTFFVGTGPSELQVR